MVGDTFTLRKAFLPTDAQLKKTLHVHHRVDLCRPQRSVNIPTMKLSLPLLLLTTLTATSAFSPPSRNAILRDLREMKMAPSPGSGGASASPDYNRSCRFYVLIFAIVLYCDFGCDFDAWDVALYFR